MLTFETIDGLLDTIAKNNKPMWNSTTIPNLSFSPTFSQYYIDETPDGFKKVVINAVGHTPAYIDITLDTYEIFIKSVKPKNSAGFVRDINLEFSVIHPFDGKLTEATIKDGILTLIVGKAKEEKSKKVKLKL